MDERNSRRRKLTPAEERNLERQRRKQRDIQRKNAKADAKYREEVRKQRRSRGENAHIIIEMPARDENYRRKPRKPRVKTTPDIIKAETNKRVRNMSPKDYADGYYVDEVEIRKAQAKEQRQKRQKQRKKQLTPRQIKIRRNLTYIAILTVIMVVGITLSLTVLFKTENIEVIGNKLYEDSTIIELAEVSQGNNIFVATMFGNRDAVEDKLPYVKDAKISFKIPNTLVIDVEHEKPYYCLKSNGECYLINEKGRILEKVDKSPKKLMTVTANGLKKRKIGGYVSYKSKDITNAVKEISDSLKKWKYTGVTAIDVAKMSQISIVYDNRILIKIGLPQDIDYKIRTAFTIINKKLEPEQKGKIKGILNVSECNNTKKSYFKEGDIKEETTSPTIVTQETTETESIQSTFVTSATDPTSSSGETAGEIATETVE